MAVVERSTSSARRFVHDSQGNEVPPPMIFQEQGANSPFGASPIDYNAALFPLNNALRTYEHMKRNDAQIRLTLRAAKVSVLTGDFFVEPADTGNTQQDKDVAEFVSTNLFDNLSMTWSQVLAHALTMLDYGFSVFETVYEIKGWAPSGGARNSRNFAMLRKIAPRPASTIIQFLYDDAGGPAGVEHQVVSPGSTPGVFAYTTQDTVTIPIDQLLIFVFDQEGGNLEGNSLLRTAYQPWYYKKNLYKIDAIQKERHGMGIPEIELPPGYSDDDVAFANNMARNMRVNEQGYIVKPAGWTVGFAEPKGNLTNALESAEHHNLQIGANALAQFVAGTGPQGVSSGGGNRASTSVGLDFFLRWQRSLGNLVCDVFNLFLVPKLVDYNFRVTRYPKLKVRGIGESRDLQMLASALRNLVSENILSVDDDTERYVRAVFDLPTVWDQESERVNEALLKPLTYPSGQPALPQGAEPPAGYTWGPPNPGAPNAGGGRGPTSGNVSPTRVGTG